jgi:hypothetical protein
VVEQEIRSAIREVELVYADESNRSAPLGFALFLMGFVPQPILQVFVFS